MDSAELKIFTVRAIASVLWKIGDDFERSIGNRLNIVLGYSPTFVKRIEAGEDFDLFVAPVMTIDRLIQSGQLRAQSRTLLVESEAGVEVRAGAPKPDISTVEAFKQALVNATSIGCLSFAGVPELIERLGLADALKSKMVLPDADIVSELVAKGKVELGIIVITQILTTPGVELVGPLPPELRITSRFAGAIGMRSKAPEAARDLLAFLQTPAAVSVMREQGMRPLF